MVGTFLKKGLLGLITAGAVSLLAFQASAVQPDEILDDPALEDRAREISKDLRCLVCQNQSIDDSNAELARDLRLIVRERLVEGDTNDEVFDFVVARYGDYVLLRPPIKPETYALWFGPAVIVLIAGIGVFVYLRGRARAVASGTAAELAQEATLSDAEQARLKSLLGGGDDTNPSRGPGERS